MLKQKKLRPPVKIHGGKYYLAQWVIEHFPEDYDSMPYIEPFIGAGSVLLNKRKSTKEIISDLDKGIMAIWKALRNNPTKFIESLKEIEYKEEVFLAAKERNEFKNYVEHATNDFIVRRMSRGGLKKAFAWSDRLRGGIPGDVNAWNTIIESLPDIANRISDVNVYTRSAMDIIKKNNESEYLLYCDPPYLKETRIAKRTYDYELETEDHIKLAEMLNSFKGKAMISGYPSFLYEQLYKDWRMVKKHMASHAGQNKAKTTKLECLWMNW